MANFSDPPRQTDGDYINLPALLSDETGVSRSAVRMEIALGTVEIDGVVSEQKFDFPRAALAGKTVVVIGERRQFKINVPAE